MGKGSARRKSLVTDQKLLDNWDRIFKNKPNDKQFEEIYGNKSDTKNTKKNEGGGSLPSS